MRGKAEFLILCGCVKRKRKCCFEEVARVSVWERQEGGRTKWREKKTEEEEETEKKGEKRIN